MRAELRQAKQCLRLVLDLLNAVDPYGLSPGDQAPWDEYEPEASSMVSLLLNAGAISGAQIDEIWTKWFGEGLSEVLDSTAFDQFVLGLNELDVSRP